MTLTGPQISRLVAELNREWDLPTLSLLATDVGINLGNIAAGATVELAALRLVEKLNSSLPPRDVELLERLRERGNSRLKEVADELLRPGFFSPTTDPHDAILLGPMAFVDRDALRWRLHEFTNPSAYTTRVLIVRGDEPCGKSYTWEFLRHLAFVAVGAKAQRLRLGDGGYTPRQLFEAVFARLGLDASKLPPQSDQPQLARVYPLIDEFKGQLARMDSLRYWLVIDDLNDDRVLPETVEAAFALAEAAEEVKSDQLWVVLLGYKRPIATGELRYVAQDDARFPDPAAVAEFLEILAASSPNPLDPSRALEIATLLFNQYAQLDKAAMSELTSTFEQIGVRLTKGYQP